MDHTKAIAADRHRRTLGAEAGIRRHASPDGEHRSAAFRPYATPARPAYGGLTALFPRVGRPARALTERPGRMARAPLVLIVAIAASLMASPAAAERTLTTLPDTDLPGGDYRTLRNIPLAACEEICRADTGCAGFTFNTRVGWCFLKNAIGERVRYRGAISAVAVEERGEPLPLPDLAGLPDDLSREAARLESQIAGALQFGRTVERVTPEVARRLDGGGAAAAIAFSNTMRTTRFETWRERREAEDAAVAAAFRALTLAETRQAQSEALLALSKAFEKRNLTRPAIEAAKTALTLADSAAERRRLDSLLTRFGFRVLDYSVDFESAEPRLCVQFSEPLQGDADALGRFVRMDGASPPISVEASQLCVEGLTHSTRVEVTVREGLPSTVGEALRAPSTITAYVRDRSPLARFQSTRTVLPASADGLPVTTVNTRALDLVLYRIDDRALAALVREGKLGEAITRWETGDLAAERGAELWQGTLEVDNVQNEAVTSLIPLQGVIPQGAPAVYAMTAAPTEAANQPSRLATQWFVVSDLGLATYAGGGEVSVFVQSLTDAEPVEGANVQLVARNNAVLAKGRADADGFVRLRAGALTGGRRPALVTARAGEDYAFVSLAKGAMELTDRGVDGRAAPGPVDAFLTTERGVYRAGETVHATVLVRNDRVDALEIPVTLSLIRPDGKISRTVTRRADTAGGFSLALPLTDNAATGTWRLAAHVDPDAPEVGSTTFLVDDYVPQKIAVALTTDAEAATPGETVAAQIAADFLYGAPAADLMLEGSVTLSAARTLPGVDGYAFGLHDETVTPRRAGLFDLPRTGADGRAALSIAIPPAPDSVTPRQARVVVAVREPSGRQVADALTLPVSGTPAIGIAARTPTVAAGGTAEFAVIALDAVRQRMAREATWTLTRIERDFQWYQRNDRWFYEPVERRVAVDRGTLALTDDAPARLSLPLDRGEYRLEVAAADDDRIASSVTVSAGWFVSGGAADTPDILPLSLDKERYAAGETARLTIPAGHQGTALMTVLNRGVSEHRRFEVPAEGLTVDLAVDAADAPGAYVAVTLVRTADDAAGRPLPQRSVGIAHLDIDSNARRLDVAIETPETARPNSALTVPVRLAGVPEGERAFLTLAAVDVGILNLTGFTPPDADGHFLGQRRLGVELRDVYGELIDASGARRGRIRSGGDGAPGGADALPPNQEPVALFSGTVPVDADGVAHVPLTLPAFDGTLKLMAVAWSDSAVGDGARDLVVRDPVVVAAAVPRFLAPGDNTRLRVDVQNVHHVAGDYRLAATTAGPVLADDTPRTLRLAVGERAGIEIPLTADAPGMGRITVTLTGPGDLRVERALTLAVREPAMPVTRRRVVSLAPGETHRLDRGLLAGLSEARLTLSASSAPVDPAGLLMMLDRFPYGCAEQTVSRALPLLYANALADTVGLARDAALPERIERAIASVLAYQTSAGGFGLWSPGNDLWLTAYVMDFLTRAREAGFDVPEGAMEAGLTRLQSLMALSGDFSNDDAANLAYAAYVLARSGRAALSDLRYFAEEKLDAFPTRLARAQLGASLALTGDPLPTALFLSEPAVSNWQRNDFGTPLRDAAALVTLAGEAGAPAALRARLTGELAEAADAIGVRPPSTQEAAWLVLASDAGSTGSSAITIDGAPSAPHRVWNAADGPGPMAVRNTSDRPQFVTLSAFGTPMAPPPPSANGLTVDKTYHTLDGATADPARVAQNTRLLVRLALTKTAAVPMRVMVSDLLPAGFEIENPRLVTAQDVAAFPLAAMGPTPEHVAFRDDRFAAAVTLSKRQTNEPVALTYMVRAVSPGRFAAPGVQAEAMYQPQFVARSSAGVVNVVPTR